MGILDLFKPNVEKMVKKRNVKGLVKALVYKDFIVRNKAAKALGKIGDARAIEPIIIKPRSGTVGEKWAAAFALRDLGWRPKNNEEKAYLHVAKREWVEAVQLGRYAVVEPLLSFFINHPFESSGFPSIGGKFLFGDYGDLIRSISCIACSLDKCGDSFSKEYDHIYNDRAVVKLCSIKTPISNNLLHLISKRSDINVVS